jgi:hypothetical protein
MDNKFLLTSSNTKYYNKNKVLVIHEEMSNKREVIKVLQVFLLTKPVTIITMYLVAINHQGTIHTWRTSHTRTYHLSATRLRIKS